MPTISNRDTEADPADLVEVHLMDVLAVLGAVVLIIGVVALEI